MTTLTEGTHNLEWLISEANGQRSRDQVTVTVSGATAIKSGTLLGKITATGKYIAYSNAASDGSQAVAAILMNTTSAVNGDYKAAVIVRDAEVWAQRLFGSDAAGLVDMNALGIAVRA